MAGFHTSGSGVGEGPGGSPVPAQPASKSTPVVTTNSRLLRYGFKYVIRVFQLLMDSMCYNFSLCFGPKVISFLLLAVFDLLMISTNTIVNDGDFIIEYL